MAINKDVIVRTIVLGLAWVNMALTSSGHNPLPFSEEEIYSGASNLVAFGATLWAYWKNNSWTPEAQKADEVLSDLKVLKKEIVNGEKY